MAPGRTGRSARAGLTRQRVLEAAVELADRVGIGPLTMRSLAAHLGVEAMSLYHHVRSKDDLLDGMVDQVFSEIYLPVVGGDWMAELRRRSTSGREVLKRHRWAVGLMDSRNTPGGENLRHHDAVLGCLRAAQFSWPMAAHAFAVLDAHLYGFMLQETSLPFEGSDQVHELAEQIFGGLRPDEVPHLVEFATSHVLQPGYDFGEEFGFGLDLILEGLERRRRAETAAART